MNFLRKNILLIALISFVIFGLIIQFTFAAGLVPCLGAECNTCHLFELLNNVINFIALQIVPVLAVAMIMVGAFFLVTAGGSETAIKKGRDVITSAVIGSLIILSAWLVIDVILKNLAPGDTSKTWYDIKCEVNK